jgi:hypothetical protein
VAFITVDVFSFECKRDHPNQRENSETQKILALGGFPKWGMENAMFNIYG